MAKKTFISYNFADREIAHSIKSIFQDNNGKVNGKVNGTCVFVENVSSVHPET